MSILLKSVAKLLIITINDYSTERAEKSTPMNIIITYEELIALVFSYI